MNILFLNLPNKQKIMRRYMCSYNSPTFLFQPIELLSLAGIAGQSGKHELQLIDAIAEGLSLEEVFDEMEVFRPDVIVSITGFECVDEDIACVQAIQKQFPHAKMILFGHYATVFNKEVMDATKVDYLIHGEPDLIFQDILAVLEGEKTHEDLSGVSFRQGDEVIHQHGAKRIPHPNKLPMPAFELLKNHLYAEPFFPQPYGLIQSARGCPYSCNFCVKSFGEKLTVLSPENMILQLEKYIDLFQIRSFRFIDDTFTATPARVIRFCKLLIEKGYNLTWSCLSRPDTLNPEMLDWMKKAGCVRLYIGIESGSQKILDFYTKGVDVVKAREQVRVAADKGFELMGFFMVGAPNEDKQDVKQSIRFAVDAGFEFIVISKLMPYPGTALYPLLKDQLNFSLLPYKHEYKDAELEKKAYLQQRYFMRQFYLNPRVVWRIVRKRFSYAFNELLKNAGSFVRYLLASSKTKSRKDYI